jgi:hypothetical protein
MIVYHLPMLAVAEGASVKALGGEVRRFRLEEFEELDSDWAHSNYFVESTAVWVTAGSPSQSHEDIQFMASAELIRLAATAVLEAPLASPRLTIRYFGLGTTSRSRRIGPFDRTLLLSDRSLALADQSALTRIGDLADSWLANGYGADHPVFEALDTFGAMYSSLNARPELRMMPTMVALEGIYAPDNAPAISKRMAAALTELLPAEPKLTASIKRLYDIRSDIIHGRPVNKAAIEVMNGVGIIACRSTLALLRRLTEKKISPDRWTDVLERQP